MPMLENLKNWHTSLPPRDMWIVNVTAALIIFTLFYLIIWEPLHKGLETENVRAEAQQKTLQWMQHAEQEARLLRTSGNGHQIRYANKPITLVLEQSLMNAGLKLFVSKIDSSGTNSARVKLDNVAFDQMLVWLNTISMHNGMEVTSATIERGDKPGRTNARLNFTRP